MKNTGMAACLLLLLLSHISRAQHFFSNNDRLSACTWELSVSAGGMNCFTDLGGHKGQGKAFVKDLDLSCTRFSAGVSLATLYQSMLGGRLEVTWGRVTAADSLLGNKASARYQRNLHFRSTIMELALLAEWHPLGTMAYRQGQEAPAMSPYLLGGVGVFYFNPEAQIGNSWFLLNGLHTEGQGFKGYPDRTPYRLTQCNIPFGAGFRWQCTPMLAARLEILHRKLFTDYLDDVSTSYVNPESFGAHLNSREAALALQLSDRRSERDHNQSLEWPAQRGNPGRKDAYFSVQLKISLLLDRVGKY